MLFGAYGKCMMIADALIVADSVVQ
jgi:hypothetical protein